MGNSIDNVGGSQRDIVDFAAFISRMDLLDLPLLGRLFTWYRPYGIAMSRLDHILISEGWWYFGELLLSGP